ncbi:hypothetical protein ACU686_40320 [Yinghuangia aomiensis]
MSIKDIAQRAAVLRTLKDAVVAESATADAELKEALREQKKVTGTTKIAIELPDETPIGSATLVQPSPKAVVEDEAAFTAWVRKVLPGEIVREFVTAVRPSTKEALLKAIATAGGETPQWCDTGTGEVHTVPGVKIQPRAAYPRMTLPEDGKQAVAEAWQRGELVHMVLPQLTPGGDA